MIDRPVYRDWVRVTATEQNFYYKLSSLYFSFTKCEGVYFKGVVAIIGHTGSQHALFSSQQPNKIKAY